MHKSIDVGILLSTSGTYRYIAESSYQGLCDAINEVNANPDYPIKIRAHHINPEGKLSGYRDGAQTLLNRGIQHLFGTSTSSSRKEIIPILEREQALLWYGCPYEGYESCEQVIYLGGCPNQTLIPMLHYALTHLGNRCALVGSNYVWGWESNRIAKEVIEASGAQICCDQYLPLGVTQTTHLVEKVLAQSPDFILNNLVGDSSWVFLAQLNEALIHLDKQMFVLSSNLSESEASQIKNLNQLRFISSGPFFESTHPEFCDQQKKRHSKLNQLSHIYTGAWLSVHLFVQSYIRAQSENTQLIKEQLFDCQHESSLGKISISSTNNHAILPCYLAEFIQGRFDKFYQEPNLIQPDPYLTQTPLAIHLANGVHTGTHHLRIIK